MRRAAAILLASLFFPAAVAAEPQAVRAPVTIRLSTQKIAVFGQTIVLRGRMIPARPNARVRITLGGTVFAHARVGPRGGFKLSVRLRSGGPYRAGWYQAVSPKVSVTVRPRLEASITGPKIVGEPLTLYAQVRPARGGTVNVEVFRNGKLTFSHGYPGHAIVKLGTPSAGEIRVRLRVRAHDGYAPVQGQVLKAKLLPPELRYGSGGPVVAQLIRNLGSLHYAVRTTGTFGSELLDSVIAFQKVQGLNRDGVVGVEFWKRLTHPRVPTARYTAPADHLEVDKTHQVLYVVRGGKIAQIIPVSTAGISGYYTPEGTFSIYRKVPGFDSSPLGTLYLPMYFTGGYAIHGNPSVPAYPASHGCVRVPMWVADALYASNGYGETVYVYS